MDIVYKALDKFHGVVPDKKNQKDEESIYTCYYCQEKDTCIYAWDLYNTNGDCLAEK